MAGTPRPVMLSGIQPTGALMIGNYVGALKSWVELQATHDSYFMLADLHALTVRQKPEDLRRRTLEFVAIFLACGVDAEKSTIFLQSHVPAHTQLLWLLNCAVAMGELQRMTQFKEKAGRDAANIHVGLFDYPVLMAADIFLYRVDLVTVGDDQKQHMEFARRLARKFNAAYGEVFKIPETYTPRTGARLMGLQTPLVKMSKSDPNADNYLSLLDPPEAVRRKIRTAVTDSGNELRCDSAKPGVSNLITLFAAVSGESVASVQRQYAGKGYAVFKKDLAERVVDFLGPIQARYHSIAADPVLLTEVLEGGGRKARERSEATLSRVYQAVGLVSGERDPERLSREWRSSHFQPPEITVPALDRALPERRIAMEANETKDVTAAADAGADAGAECLTDCCVCCCCETEEECGMEE